MPDRSGDGVAGFKASSTGYPQGYPQDVWINEGLNRLVDTLTPRLKKRAHGFGSFQEYQARNDRQTHGAWNGLSVSTCTMLNNHGRCRKLFARPPLASREGRTDRRLTRDHRPGTLHESRCSLGRLHTHAFGRVSNSRKRFSRNQLFTSSARAAYCRRISSMAA